MSFVNNMAFAQSMDATKWVALVVAVLGMGLLFTDLILNIRKRQHLKLNIVALVFLSLALICFVLLTWIIKDMPPVMSIIWIVFLTGYFVCDIILAVGIGKDNRRKRLAEKAEEGDMPQAELMEEQPAQPTEAALEEIPEEKPQKAKRAKKSDNE